MWTATVTHGVGGASALVAGARGEHVVLASADPPACAPARAVAVRRGPAPSGAWRRGARARFSPGARRVRWLPVSASVALHLLLFALSAWLSTGSSPDRPPELLFQVTVPSMESAEHEESPPPGAPDLLEDPPPEAADPSSEAAVVVEGAREEPPPPEPEEPTEELPPDPTFEPAPGFGPPPARVRLRPEPAPAPSAVATSPAAPGGVPAPPHPPAATAPASIASRAQSAVEHASGLSGNRPPAYPAEARRRGEQGTVRLEIEVDALGTVTSVLVLRSSGSMALDEAARAAALAWKFRPARRDGVAVRAVLERNVTFLLRE